MSANKSAESAFCIGVFVGSALSLVITNFIPTTTQLKKVRVSVATGEYSCQLITQEDKTTEWECLKNETRR